jgi:hypothetical protein
VESCVDPDEDLGKECSCSIDQHIAEGRFAKRYKGLMPFVESRKTYRDDQGNHRPIQLPSGPLRANAMEYGDAKDRELGDVSSLANAEVSDTKHVVTCGRKQPSQNRQNNATGLLGGEVVRGEGRDHDCDNDGRNPIFQFPYHGLYSGTPSQ